MIWESHPDRTYSAAIVRLRAASRVSTSFSSVTALAGIEEYRRMLCKMASREKDMLGTTNDETIESNKYSAAPNVIGNIHE